MEKELKNAHNFNKEIKDLLDNIDHEMRNMSTQERYEKTVFMIMSAILNRYFERYDFCISRMSRGIGVNRGTLSKKLREHDIRGF